MPAIEEWEDQFNEADTDYDSRFLEWGAQWKEVLDAITASVSNINMKLTHEQKRYSTSTLPVYSDEPPPFTVTR